MYGNPALIKGGLVNLEKFLIANYIVLGKYSISLINNILKKEMVKNLKTISFSGLDSQLEKNRSDINKALKNVLDSCQFIMGKD